MDKTGLLHSINGLRRRLRTGKNLRSACTVLGQQIGSRKKQLFCTSDAVDMQRLFHSRILVTAVRQASLTAQVHVLRPGTSALPRCFLYAIHWLQLFGWCRASCDGVSLDCYSQKLVYKMIVVVNAGRFVDKTDFFHNIRGLRSR